MYEMRDQQDTLQGHLLPQFVVWDHGLVVSGKDIIEKVTSLKIIKKRYLHSEWVRELAQ